MSSKLIVFYSYTGNTKAIANMIKDKKGYDIIEIEPINSYSTDYQQVVDEEEVKMNQNEIIDIKDINIDFDKYDEIILGTPVWWYTCTPAIRSFLNKYDLKNKKTHVFVTNGGWLGHTIVELKKYIDVIDFINIVFDSDKMRTPQNEVDKWINEL